ncbi:GPI-anchor transamidase [Purpureocillium lavendulum]|uniref:GPI-anchor transamidase n=1 Tax=Purpureocillium lavendulum TaxID=1247861 RepID=A0AB34G2B1_9HYPO|nr:GPI-anchor transamidase [Purpureocillium lavendulum]
MKLPDMRFPVLVALAMFVSAALAEHTSNWAVLVCTSRFWFNYRHLANVLSMYRTVKRLGIPDSQIILMLPDDMACNPRNAFPGTVYSNSDRAVDLYGDNIEVDYRGYEVTVENFIRLLTDRVGAEMPRSKRLLTDDRSNILVYMTGHGGNEFLKFQDAEEIGAYDLADAFEQMWEKKRYHEILFMIDTCQANTMYSRLYSPNIIATGSSELDQSSYSHHADNDVGVAVIDRYTYYNLEFLESQVQDLNSAKTVGDLFDSYDYEKIHSNAGVRYDLFPGGADAARSRLITDFFGNIQNVEVDRAKDSELEEKLLELSKTISLLREKEAEEARVQTNMTSVPASVPTEPVERVQGAKALTNDDWWTKKIVGATALAGFRPLSPHALAWSCDAELAVALDDSIHIFLPDFATGDDRDDASVGKTVAVAQPQFSMALHAAGLIQPDPALNAKLCASAGVKSLGPRAAEDFKFQGVGSGQVTGSGAAVGQVVRVEWSPSGLGHSLRPVVAALTTSGCIVVLGEAIDTGSTINASATTRTFRNWKILWGIGARMPIPDEQRAGGIRKLNDKIVSFSWAKEVQPGHALLAYANDRRKVVIMGVQLSPHAQGSETARQQYRWKLSELARFDASGPHTETDQNDADFTPGGSAFCLRWSPWYVTPKYRTATLAYIARDHVGFRRITISGDWEATSDPMISVELADTTGICLPLSADALVEWEDAVWTEGEKQMARGIIATPFDPKPFQVDLRGGADKMSPGLVVHRPDLTEKPPAPRYSLVRLSATVTNQDWYQTNVPESEMPLPQWAERVGRLIIRTAPRVGVMQGDFSDPESDEDEEMMDDDDDDEELPLSKVYAHRFRFWGLASSPGDGTTAVLVTRHNTQHPHRRARSSIFFGWYDPRDSSRIPRIPAPDDLTTEGRLWEAVYGGKGDVASILPSEDAAPSALPSSPLHDLFRDVVPQQRCVFCDAGLGSMAKEAKCENGHTFGKYLSEVVGV